MSKRAQLAGAVVDAADDAGLPIGADAGQTARGGGVIFIYPAKRVSVRL